MTKSKPPLLITLANCLATENPSVAGVFTLIASSAPMAKALRKVGSVSAPPTFATVT